MATGSESRFETAHCAVTVLCGQGRVDVALPSAVACADLMPSLLRLLHADHVPATTCRWVLTPIGGQDLELGDTLGAAGVLDGDVLVLRARPEPASSAAVMTGSLRDHLEDVVEATGRTWTARTSARCAVWTVTVAGTGLLAPAGALCVGPVTTALDTAVAIVVALAAIVAARRAPAADAAVCLVVGCLWAGLAGWTMVVCLSPPPVDPGRAADGQLPLGVAVAAACAWLLAASVVAAFPAALVAVAVCGVITAASAALTLASTMGVPTADGACTAGLIALLAIGVAPRAALVLGGLGATGTLVDRADVDARIVRADRLLTGLIVGWSVVAVVGACVAAASGDGWHRVLAVAVGLGLGLRSRVFSQIPHVLGPRVGSLVAAGGVWVGLYRTGAVPAGMLVLGATVLGGAIAVGVCLTPALTPIARARAGRFMDIAEWVLVVASVVVAAGVLGLFGWVGSVVG